MRGVIAVVFVVLLGFAGWKGRADTGAGANVHGFMLRDVAHQAGIDFVHKSARLDPKLDNIMPQVAGETGAAVSIVDADGDGWSDLYVTTNEAGGKNALYVNKRDGTFVDRAVEAGLADCNVAGTGASMGSIWADADGDGDLDVYVYKLGRGQLFRNEGGSRFTDVTDVSAGAGLGRWMNCAAATWIDYDRDGLVDLFTTGYFRDDVDLWNLKTTRIMQDSFEFSNNGGHRYLYRNLGGMRFEDVTARTGCDGTRWALAVAAADMDGDGWQDLYVANDYGPEELFLNQGGVRFERAEKVGLDESSKSGMSVAMGDVLGEGRLGVFVTNISKAGYLFQGNNLRLNRLRNVDGASAQSGRGHLVNVAEDAVLDCGWAWGAQFGDLDNDGLPDLFVANGFVSASRERDYWFDMSKISGAAGEIAEDAANWPPMGDRSLSGFEVSSVLLNKGHKRFIDVAHAVGVRDELDGRAVALGDLFQRGALDVVVANQDAPLLVYENEVDRDRRWIQLELVGRPPNTSAIGAQATIRFGAQTCTAVVQAASGYCAQNEMVLHFGLGAHEVVDELSIRWPSGTLQKLANLRARERHRIQEPAP
jgi:hypothetical protein